MNFKKFMAGALELPEDGDRVEWVYTCDLGLDVGGHYSARNGY